MTNALSTAQMRAIEKAAIDSGAVTGLELMERAGQGVVAAVLAEWPEFATTSHHAAVLCGPGNNGGDGFVVARLLKHLGWQVSVYLYGDAHKLSPDAAHNYARWRALGENVKSATEFAEATLRDGRVDLCVDALFGTGLDRQLPAALHGWVGATRAAQSSNGRVKTVAVDIASGICADSGRVIGTHGALAPHLTVTFHAAKIGHYLDQGTGSAHAARVVIVDIGLETPTQSTVTCIDQAALPSGLHSKSLAAHKYTHGHAVILAGGSGQGGAARLAARGALRIGAGAVTLLCPPDSVPENAAHLNAIMLHPVADAGALAHVLDDTRINAICIGPGFGLSAHRSGMVMQVLKLRNECAAYGRPVVLDADALTLMAADPELMGLLHENCVLTPHAAEFARLFPDIAAKLAAPASTGPAYSKVDATRDAAARAGCVVLFKGPDTVIAAPDGRCAINAAHYDRAAPWLATAGSGDVLAGYITGLLARGFSPMQAAESAAWLHVECARQFGPSLIAEDLPEQLPGVFRRLGG